MNFLSLLLHSYAALVFSTKNKSGALVFLATLYDPLVGLFGLLGNIIVNGTATLLHVDKNYIHAGVFGVNGILIGLGIGLYTGISISSFALLLLASLLSVLVALIFINEITLKFHLPIMSFPFVVSFWVLLLALEKFSSAIPHSVVAPIPFLQKIDSLFSLHSPHIANLFRAFGSLIFMPSLFTGVCIVAAIFIASRISLAFGILGAITGLIVINTVGEVSAVQPFGLNEILVAIAIGGFFLAPNLSGIIYTVFGVAVCVLVSNGMEIFLKPFGLQPLVFPFNITVLFLLYPLQSKILYAHRAGLIMIPLAHLSSPENHLQWYQEKYGKKNTIDYSLPFFGAWYVSQGPHGKYTHKGTQAHAYDFVVIDNEGKQFSGLGIRLEEYYCFGLPILSPAEGKIISVENSIPDNPPGVVNEKNNWGNHIIIEHAEGEYTEISHFKCGTIIVNAGDTVKSGQQLGLCGNSGYSPTPHIHIQRQKGSFVASESVPMKFSHYENILDGRKQTIEKGMLPEGAVVRSYEQV
jgi:urea transporter